MKQRLMPVTPLEIFATTKSVIFAQVGRDCVGISRETLTVEWYLRGSQGVMGDGVMYMETGATVYALPLEALEEVKGGGMDLPSATRAGPASTRAGAMGGTVGGAERVITAAVAAGAPAATAGARGGEAGDEAGAQKTSRTWTSANGRHALRVDETISTTMRHRDGATRGTPATYVERFVGTQVTGLAIAADGMVTQQWLWSERNVSLRLEVADALVGDSGKRFVLLGRHKAKTTPDPVRVVVILDEEGKIYAQIMAKEWAAAFGTDVDIADNDPKLRLLDNEKTLEITLKSGAVVHVNVETEEITVIKRPATAPASAPAATRPGAMGGAGGVGGGGGPAGAGVGPERSGDGGWTQDDRACGSGGDGCFDNPGDRGTACGDAWVSDRGCAIRQRVGDQSGDRRGEAGRGDGQGEGTSGEGEMDQGLDGGHSRPYAGGGSDVGMPGDGI